MGLISKTVITKWNPTTRQHYENKGYEYTGHFKEFEVKVDDLPNGSHTYVRVECDHCKKETRPIIWKNYLKQIRDDGKYYCKKCYNELFVKEKTAKTKLEKGKSFEQWCIDNNRQDILDRWDYELNGISPSEVCYSSKGLNKKGYYFKCPRGLHESELKNINSFTRKMIDGYTKCNKCNSFAQWGIDNIGEDFLEKYWDYEKNEGIDPWLLSYGIQENIFIRCQEKDYHGSYKVIVNSFTSVGSRCSFCNKNSGKVHPLDSLGQYIIDNYGKEFLNNVWSNKNNKSPFEYTPKSTKKIWWKCLDGVHKEYKRSIKESNSYDFRCPCCSKEKEESILQEKVRLYLESLNIGEILHEHNCTIVPKNPKTKKPLPFDNELIGKDFKLIIEVHGRQHYELLGTNNTWLYGLSQEEYLHYQKLKDRYKKIYSCIQGYEYLEISYKTDDKQETYKQLIDNKIQEILKQSV